ncbi:hypothetical protein FEM48_Zijuj09G0144900 [Ziziphus jujuba var. spinosa]|uniref:DUF7036 domain-containing protein n=1 Tax=Ziziphus jujuba var. spinosa TaxID=714518 RepID=A0A978UTI6_ZIZJJ|nr:hypothetical protein FEM48_Zijuj09G0144900 [Ziziphus jujuba var. spinosa]
MVVVVEAIIRCVSRTMTIDNVVGSNRINTGKSIDIDATDHGSPVQAYFTLEKPVSELVPHIGRLEYDINAEIGVPDTKVAVLSMHRSGASNCTAVVFGVLSDPVNIPINQVYLSLLRSSLIEVFLQQSNLTVTTSIFGQPSKFEILKFQGGITVIPMQAALIWQKPQILFNFTLNNSIADILGNFSEFKDQLKSGLHLTSYENVYVQITNKFGSTTASPVIVQASVLSDLGSLLPQRLKQLAQTITGSPIKNLGLDNSVFGKVKSISLSSYLKGTLSASPPSPSPAPSPELTGPSISPYSAPSTYPPAPSPDTHDIPPYFNNDASPAPSVVNVHPPLPCIYRGLRIAPTTSPASPPNPTVPQALTPSADSPHMGPISQFPPVVSPVQEVSSALSPGERKGNAKGLVAPLLAPFPSSLAIGPSFKEIWLLGFSGLVMFHLLCWSY